MADTRNLTANNIAAIVREQVIATITRKKERDKQRRIGPSDLGDTCEFCLGSRLLGQIEEREFSIFPWLGTAVHLWLEQNEKNPQVTSEQRVEVGEVPGYGRIKGTLDRYDAEYALVGDYKLLGNDKIKAMNKAYIINADGTVTIHNERLWQYYVQINAYGVGARQAGHKVDWVTLILIPRGGSGSINNLEVLAFPINESVVAEALARAQAIYEYVQEFGTEGLESDPACYACSVAGRW